MPPPSPLPGRDAPMRALKFAIPLVVFIALAIFLAVGLTKDPREVPSPFIGKPAPSFKLERLREPSQAFGPDEMKGKVWMLNVWASWCVACREEHPVLVEFSKRNSVPIVGLNWKDSRENGLKWLGRFGDPYALSVFDGDGRVGIDYGVYGAPETFVIDRDGVIRYKQIGAITPEALDEKILPLLKSLGA
jgi:cytochrome c biogenesis protein CcmG/thiol:disulfide interchange protein DsbE